MNKQSKLYKRARGVRIAAGASGLALIMGLVNVAVGSQLTITVDPTPTSVGDIDIDSNAPRSVETSQFLDESVAAEIEGSTFSDVDTGGSTIIVPDNAFTVIAGGNKADSGASINLLETTADFSIGSAQAAVLGAVVAAEISGDQLVNIVFSAPVNNATVSGVSASTEAAVNRSVALITQVNLQGFDDPVDTADRTATVDAAGTDQIDVTANGVIANYQLATDAGGKAGSGATIDGAGIVVDAAAVGITFATDSAITLSDNQISAAYGVNDASSQYLGSGTAFNGSLAIANLQDNVEDAGTGSDPTASITDGGVTITTDANEINGNITVSGQTFEAQSDGNNAINRLVLDVTTDVVGGGAGTLDVTVDANDTDLLASAEQATLAIVSAQRNQGTYLESSITDSGIMVSGTGGDGAITLSDNSSQASATGNAAENRLSINAGTVDDASTAIANAQVNMDTDVVASNTSNVIVTGAGTGPIAHTGAVALSGNTIGSMAVGSTASNVNLVESDTGINSTATNAAFVTHSRQFSDGGAVTATTTSGIGANLDGDVAINGLLADNTLESVAVVNSALNTLGLTAGTAITLAGGASLINDQESASGLTSTTDGSVLIDITSASPINGNANAIGNTLRGVGIQNEAINTLVLTAGTTASGAADISNTQQSSGITNVGVTSNGIGVETSGTDGTIEGAATVTGNTLQSQAVANLASNSLSIVSGIGSTVAGSVVNDQTNTAAGAVSATTTLDGRLGVTAGDSLGTDGTATVGSNRASALAYGNNASNVLNANGGAGVLGGHLINSSVQSNEGNITSEVIGGATLTGPAIGLAMAATSTTAYTANMLGNSVSSTAYGNSAQNALNALSTGGMTLTASAELASVQTNTGAVTASVSGAVVGIVGDGGAVGGRSVISGNTISATAVGNSSVSQMVIGR